MPSDVAGVRPRPRSRRPAPRERLLKAADELFYAEGINSVGIDRIIERADVARASLYSTFGSKDELIRGYLERRAEILQERLRAAAEVQADPREALLSVFSVQAATFARPGYQGCAFNRATAEAAPGSAAYEVPRAYRRWLHDFLRDLAAAAGAPEPDQLASQIHLLYDGANLAASLDGIAGVSAASRSAAEALLDAALTRASSGRHRKQEQAEAPTGTIQKNVLTTRSGNET
jgi:AcrR family transcriptional regulator